MFLQMVEFSQVTGNVGDEQVNFTWQLEPTMIPAMAICQITSVLGLLNCWRERTVGCCILS